MLFGTANALAPTPEPTAAGFIDMGWLFALHARSAIARNQVWQALHMIGGVRDQALALACLRHGLPTAHGRGIDRLPREDTAAAAEALVRSLDAGEVRRGFGAAVEALIAEIDRADADLARRLADPLREMVRSTPDRAD